MCGHSHDVVIYSKFHRNPFRGFGTPGDQNLAFPITSAVGYYNSLYYRTSRDVYKRRYINTRKYRRRSQSDIECVSEAWISQYTMPAFLW